MSKMKAFPEDKIQLAKIMIFVFDWTKNIVRKREKTGYYHFLLFPQCFQKAYFSGSLKVGIVWYIVNSLPNDKILDWFKFKAFADDHINVIQKLKVVLDWIENIVTSIFSFSTMFSKAFIFMVV